MDNLKVLSTLPVDHAAFSIVDQNALRRLSEAEARHFWFRTRNDFVSQRLLKLGCAPPDRVLELGCGGGAVCAHLSRLGYEVTGVDGHLDRVREAARRAPRGLFFVHDLAKGTAPFLGGAYDAVGLFDVIEHLDEPRQALISALECARPGGVVVGTVPALMALWSEVDDQAGHRLRYEPRGLAALLGSLAGCSSLEIRRFNRILVPMLFLERRLLRRRRSAVPVGTHLKVPPAPINRAFDALLRLEQALDSALEWLRLPGASLWFALRKDSPKSAPRLAVPS